MNAQERAAASKPVCASCHSWEDWHGTGQGHCLAHDKRTHAKDTCGRFDLISPENLKRKARERVR